MISCDSVTKAAIRSHYDLATPFYRLLWGPHIRHGLWEDATPSAGDASPRDAQLHLTNTLADLANVSRGSCVLDVGCGMGGSSIHLAHSRDCRVADSPAKRPQVEKVCEAFLCPSLGSFSDYRGWMQYAGLVVDVTNDWTNRAAQTATQTWELCEARVNAWISRLARMIDPAQALFLKHFSTLLNAYRSGAMQSGCCVAHRPSDEPS
ncbi:MAG: hypothetical protein CK530_11700 [Planctomycetaceae bacterium]|nr:MAG: hypothetical protein CK530_11700 [Planctomycetaceae bacterium]